VDRAFVLPFLADVSKLEDEEASGSFFAPAARIAGRRDRLVEFDDARTHACRFGRLSS
jgi:hypothetical protein